MIEPKPVTLLDGTVVDSSSEAWRAECEARMVLAYPSTQLRREYLEQVGRKRGEAAVEQLKATILVLWERRKAGHPLHGPLTAA